MLLWMIFFNIRPVQDPDIWWHLASGRYMVEHAIVPKTDVFSLSGVGSPWVDTYWLQEIMIYCLYLMAGLKAVSLANAIAIAMIVFLMTYTGPPPDIPWANRLAGVLWIFLASHPRGYGWGEKASLVTLGFIGLLTYTLRRTPWPQSRLARTWPLLFMVWANMHRGFILGLLILSFHVLEKWLKNESRSRLAMGWCLCVCATLVNPWGYRVYTLGWQDIRLSPAVVAGWAHTPFFHLELFWISLVIFWGFACLAIWKRQSPGLGFLLTSLTLSVVSIRYASLYPYFIAWGVPWVLSEFQQSPLAKNARTWGPWAVVLTIPLSWNIKPAFGVNASIFPIRAVQFLKANNLRDPFFHDYEFGGYFLWSLKGRPPVFIDGRYPAVGEYRKIFPQMYLAIQGPAEKFGDYLASFGLEEAVLKYPPTRNLPRPFTFYFPRRQWAMIYWDDLVMIFVKRTAAHEKTIAAFEFKTIEPDADPTYWRRAVWAGASTSRRKRLTLEALRNVKLHPESRRAQFWLDFTGG